MKVSRLTRVACVATLAALGLAACGGSSSGGNNTDTGAGTTPSGSATASATPTPTITGQGGIIGAGSSFQATIEQQWTAGYKGARVTYNPVGSGTGVQAFDQGSADYAASDVTLESDQQTASVQHCNGPALTFPVIAGGVAIIYNLPQLTQPLKLDAPTIAKIFEGQIKTWNDPAITALNPGVTLPSTPISPVHRSDGSGTTSVLSSFLTAEAGSAWTLGTGETLTWPQDAGSAQDGSSGVTTSVSQTPGGITYAEQSYVTGSLKAAEIKSPQGQFVPISTSGASKSIATGYTVPTSGKNLNGTLDFPKMKGYPLSTVSYLIACQKYPSSSMATSLKAFFNYAITTGQQNATKLQYAPLPSPLVKDDEKLIKTIS